MFVQSYRRQWRPGLVRKKAGAFESRLARIQSGRECVIGSGRAESGYALTIFRLRSRENIFEFAQFVAAVETASEIVVLYQ